MMLNESKLDKIIKWVTILVLPIIWIGYLILDKQLYNIMQLAISSKSGACNEFYGPTEFFRNSFLIVIVFINFLNVIYILKKHK